MMVTVLVAAALQALPVQSVVRDGSRGRTPVTVTATPPPNSASSPHTVRRRSPGSKPRVVVDAGHGGVDAGGPMRMGSSVHEKDITLQVALKLGQPRGAPEPVDELPLRRRPAERR